MYPDDKAYKKTMRKQRLYTGEAYEILKEELCDNDVSKSMKNNIYCKSNYNYDTPYNHTIIS